MTNRPVFLRAALLPIGESAAAGGIAILDATVVGWTAP